MDYTIDSRQELWLVTSSYVDRDGDHLQLYARPYPDEPVLWQANDNGYCTRVLRTAELQSAIKDFAAIFGLKLNNYGQVEYNASPIDVAIRRVFEVMIKVDQYIVHALGEYSQYQYTNDL